MRSLILEHLDQAAAALHSLRCDVAMLDTIAAAGAHMGAALQAGHRLMTCGNGGSMADAIHCAEELTGRYRADRPPLAAMAISDPGHLSCVANDYGYERVFSRYVRAHGRPGDWLLAISTSGTSPNVLHAMEAARDADMVVIGLSRQGFAGSFPDYDIRTGPARSCADRVQELHIKVIHALIDVVERTAFGAPA